MKNIIDNKMTNKVGVGELELLTSTRHAPLGTFNRDQTISPQIYKST